MPRRSLRRRTFHTSQSCGITQRLHSRAFLLKKQRNTRTWAAIATGVATMDITPSTAEPAKPLGELYYPHTQGKRSPMTLAPNLPPRLPLKGSGPPPKMTATWSNPLPRKKGQQQLLLLLLNHLFGLPPMTTQSYRIFRWGSHTAGGKPPSQRRHPNRLFAEASR